MLPIPARGVAYTARTVTYLLTVALFVASHGPVHSQRAATTLHAASGRDWTHAPVRRTWMLWLLNRVLRLLGSSTRSLLRPTGFTRLSTMLSSRGSAEGRAMLCAAVGESHDVDAASTPGTYAQPPAAGRVVATAGGGGEQAGLTGACEPLPEHCGGHSVLGGNRGGRRVTQLPPLRQAQLPHHNAASASHGDQPRCELEHDGPEGAPWSQTVGRELSPWSAVEQGRPGGHGRPGSCVAMAGCGGVPVERAVVLRERSLEAPYAGQPSPWKHRVATMLRGLPAPPLASSGDAHAQHHEKPWSPEDTDRRPRRRDEIQWGLLRACADMQQFRRAWSEVRLELVPLHK